MGYILSYKTTNKKRKKNGTLALRILFTGKEKTGIYEGQKLNEVTPINAHLTCWRACPYHKRGGLEPEI